MFGTVFGADRIGCWGRDAGSGTALNRREGAGFVAGADNVGGGVGMGRGKPVARLLFGASVLFVFKRMPNGLEALAPSGVAAPADCAALMVTVLARSRTAKTRERKLRHGR